MTDDLFEDEKTNEKKDTSVAPKTEAGTDRDKIDTTIHDSDEETSWIPLDENDLEISYTGNETNTGGSANDQTAGEKIDQAFSGPIKTGAENEKQDTIAEENNDESSSLDEPPDPPWDEMIEMPPRNKLGFFNKTHLLIFFAVIAFAAFAFFGLYTFLQYRQMSGKQVAQLEDKIANVDNRMKDKIVFQEMEEEKSGQTEQTSETKGILGINAAPVISGEPMTTVVEGASYAFVPEAADKNVNDDLTFFIANQPPWTTFDLTTGELKGIPERDDVGTYENIVILVSDGAATTALSSFEIAVLPAEPPTAQVNTAPPQDFKDIFPKPEKEKILTNLPSEAAPEVETTSKAYTLPDLRMLIRQSDFEKAAYEYYQTVKQVPEAYSLKLEVVCAEESIRIAFDEGDFDQRMFILPKKINERDCFVVFWGLYADSAEAIAALSSVPPFFTEQDTKPRLILIDRYL